MCKIDGCKTKAVARGFCAKHYMRVRRTGDAATVRKAGRHRDQGLADLTEAYSRRTAFRVRQGVRWLQYAGADSTAIFKLMTEACRPMERPAPKPGRLGGVMNAQKFMQNAAAYWIGREPPKDD